jgi:hypothetical protein
MSQTMLEYVLCSMYIAIISSGAFTDHERELANDTLFRCAGLSCAPPRAPEILRRIAANAVNQQAGFDPPEPPPARPRFRVIDGGTSAA